MAATYAATPQLDACEATEQHLRACLATIHEAFVAINNAITLIAGKFTDGFITNLNGQNGVTCQAYSDKAATKKVGGRFGKGGVKFNGGKAVAVAAVKCSK